MHVHLHLQAHGNEVAIQKHLVRRLDAAQEVELAQRLANSLGAQVPHCSDWIIVLLNVREGDLEAAHTGDVAQRSKDGNGWL
ncbi:hypothetical protein GQ600_8205 [Phytophthora cactorum]|nr:hypothetical protein GQ600_8205 [Phytophthora cactorum]